MPKVTINPKGDVIDIDSETDLLTALREQDIYIKSSCGGHASCTDCVVKILEGADDITTPTFEETQLMGNVFHITKERLACQTKACGDIVIDISKHDKAKDQTQLKSKTQSQFRKKNTPSTKVRKPQEIEEVMAEREQIREEKQQKRDEWQKHWERDKDPSTPKKLGGNRRPKGMKIRPDED